MLTTQVLAATLLPTATRVPVEPGAGEARQWLLTELAKQPYAAARPTVVDLAAQAVLQWLESLVGGIRGPGSSVFLVIGIVVIVALLVVAVLLFGVPRVNRRSRAGADTLFGEQDGRSAAQLRAAAARAAASGDLTLAVLEAFRALARGLEERTLVLMLPGTTASGFALSASAALPAETTALEDAAATFDAVRYAGRPGTAAQYTAITELDARCVAARPMLAAGAPAADDFATAGRP